MQSLSRFVAVLAAAWFVVISMMSAAHAQNWSLVIKDVLADTPTNQVNGVVGGEASLFVTLLNFTGTAFSDDGTGVPAPATSLDFAGFGWILNPGQFDLESRFTSDPRIPGFPRVPGSADGVTPGMFELAVLGTFSLAGLGPGIYEQDFVVSAFPTDFNSTVPFEDIFGTLRLNVQSGVAAPEPPSVSLVIFGAICCVFILRLGRTNDKVFVRIRCLLIRATQIPLP